MERESQHDTPTLLRERLSQYDKCDQKYVNKALDIPPKKVVDLIDSEDFDPPDAIKLLQLCYWYFYGNEATKKMRRYFGDNIEVELGIDLSKAGMARMQYELEDPIL